MVRSWRSTRGQWCAANLKHDGTIENLREWTESALRKYVDKMPKRLLSCHTSLTDGVFAKSLEIIADPLAVMTLASHIFSQMTVTSLLEKENQGESGKING